MHERSALNKLLAFSHIEKAAGTTLIHILRRIFFLRFGAVAPLRSGDGPYLTLRDLRTYQRLNPWLSCISGHSVVPHGELAQLDSGIRFITQLRQPVARAISQYKFWISRMGKDVGPHEFLGHHTASNFQTKKIAGCEDLDRAKQIISERYLLAGTVEQFDEFLVLLANKLHMPIHAFVYEKRNEARADSGIELPPDFAEELAQRNSVDTALYEWVTSELHQSYVSEYEGDYAATLARFIELQNTEHPPAASAAIDYVFRNVYWKPVTGALRVKNGLPYSGSYGSN